VRVRVRVGVGDSKCDGFLLVASVKDRDQHALLGWKSERR
jgi:hypothetical protein